MKHSAPRVLMVGTALEGRGGVAAVISVLRQDGLFERERVRYVATHREGSAAVKARSALSGFWQTLLACFSRRPSVVHVHAASGASFLRKSIVLLIARLAGCKTIFHLHGGGFRQFATVEAGALMRRWIRHTLEASSVVITLSNGWAGFVRGFAPGSRVAVVPNSVPLPPASSVQGEPGRILFLGRLEASKGVFELLGAGALLAARFPSLRLVFGGEGDADALRNKAAELGIGERIELPGWLGARERDAQLARASVFCLPSHAEGLPMSMLEAMAAGRAVVASSVGGIPETIVDGDNGLLAPPRDEAALAGKLEQVLGNEALRARLARNARVTIEQHYSTEVVCGQLSALYRELAGTQ
ncbi:glycosyltransferase family 4 protein [Massilia aerilata]|uniref:Glycosyltransferase family 4 protein n=1 Tax=Massilia aerilata TaxID=453817 RepID=A0ABW0S5P9_9BURK